MGRMRSYSGRVIFAPTGYFAGASMLNPIRFIENNCQQCWNCKKCEGGEVIRWRDSVAHPFRFYELPVCRIDGGKAMYEVYKAQCPEFEDVTSNEQRKEVPF